MPDFLDILIRSALESVDSGYYRAPAQVEHRPVSLRNALVSAHGYAIIAEIKLRSPAHGGFPRLEPLSQLAKQFEMGGASGISVVTEPKHFGGSLQGFVEARSTTTLPMLMKDIVVDGQQLLAARSLGADAILLMTSVFNRIGGFPYLNKMISMAHDLGIEVMVESDSEEEFRLALSTGADLLGINNRDLRDLSTDVGRTERILSKVDFGGRVIVSESGISRVEQLRRLRSIGVKAFLIGGSLMLSKDPEEFLKGLVVAG